MGVSHADRSCYNSGVIQLCPITPDTYQACVDLTVAPDQRDFVAPNLKSLAQADVWPGSVARLVCSDGVPVGFVVPENARARRLYRSAGFVETGDIREGETVMVYRAAARRTV
jgi:hypothetical protein